MSDNSSILLEGRQDCREAAKTLILGSVGRVYLITQHLEPELYNDAEIYDHLSQLAVTRNWRSPTVTPIFALSRTIPASPQTRVIA